MLIMTSEVHTGHVSMNRRFNIFSQIRNWYSSRREIASLTGRSKKWHFSTKIIWRPGRQPKEVKKTLVLRLRWYGYTTLFPITCLWSVRAHFLSWKVELMIHCDVFGHRHLGSPRVPYSALIGRVGWSLGWSGSLYASLCILLLLS